ncbi:PAP2 superfamily domain-containing protein [Trichoderma barbatum]
MAVGAFLEPFVVVTLLFGGAWFNRNKDYDFWKGTQGWAGGSTGHKRRDDFGIKRLSTETNTPRSPTWSSGSSSPTLSSDDESPWSLTTRRRNILFFGFKKTVTTPNTLIFKDRFLSRVLQKFPFLVEAWYWALIYWVYQLGRAFTAITIVEGTVHVARKHALQLVHLEQRLGIFWEVAFQKWFLERPVLLHWINRVYSFIHIPGTIFFLVALFYLTTSQKRRVAAGRVRNDVVSAGPALYEARRRTMAMCNLIAFVVFTLWPCMPPRLLSDSNYNGPDAPEAKSFGFVDSVHSNAGESSVWTTNRFCNQYAAMPSLHFGYSLLVGLTIATLPVNGVRPNSWKRVAIGVVGLSYPALIFTAIVATANHFILDAVAGAMVCGLAWNANGLLLNLCALEDYFLWVVRIHKPVNFTDPETAVEPEYRSILLSEDV